MLEIASQMIICLLLAALIGFIIGYLFGKSTCTSDDCGHDTTTLHQESHTEEIQNSNLEENKKPVLLTAPRDGKKDNLTRIKGIGVKIEASLNEAGIYHFDQIASWDKDNIAWANSTLGFPGRAEREQWVAQAQALDAGEETEFSKRVDAGEVATSKQS